VIQQVHAKVGPPRGRCATESMTAPTIDVIGVALFGIAVLHTFAAKLFERRANRYPRHAGLFHLLGEVEVVFGFWAIVRWW